MELTHSGSIIANVFSIEHGLQNYENLDLIRIKSKECNLLIMYDHLPILGNVDGSIELVFKDETMTIDNIQGYFMFKNNIFKFIVKE